MGPRSAKPNQLDALVAPDPGVADDLAYRLAGHSKCHRLAVSEHRVMGLNRIVGTGIRAHAMPPRKQKLVGLRALDRLEV